MKSNLSRWGYPDNRLANLACGTQKDNVKDSIKE